MPGSLVDASTVNALTPRLYDWSVSSEHLGFYGRPICNRANHYILPCYFFLSIFFFHLFFPRLISAAVGCLPYFDTWCGPSANLESSSETAARGSLQM